MINTYIEVRVQGWTTEADAREQAVRRLIDQLGNVLK
jgi:hypothetical protein